MLIDARTLAPGTRVDADLCLIGAGAAGITIAREFAGTGLRVALLESGGHRPDTETQALYKGENLGIDYADLDACRSRYLGGSTNCWGGWCRPFDAIDFRARAWMPDSGWPFARAELEPFYARACDVLQVASNEWSPTAWAAALAGRGVHLLPVEPGSHANLITQFSPPLRFGRHYREELRRTSNLLVFLHANVTELDADPDTGTVRTVRAATLSGVCFTVVPRLVVLCAGGIENARLLLASRGAHPAGLGNAHDMVGRYFMDHPAIPTVRGRLGDPARYRRLYDHTLALTRRWTRNRSLRMAAHLAPSEATQARHGLPNSRTYLVADYFGGSSPTYVAFERVRRQVHGLVRYGVDLREFGRAIGQEARILMPRLPQLALAVLDNRLNFAFVRRSFRLETVFEPIPNRDSRVTLSPETDRLGVPRARVDWRLTEADRRNLHETVRVLRDDLDRRGLFVADPGPDGEVRWPEKVEGCWHHMGTTRMSVDPRRGVVDPDCRVHGVPNLYVAGSSVFPTVGSDIPTMTIVALALRLAAHLRQVLGASTATGVAAEPAEARRPARPPTLADAVAAARTLGAPPGPVGP